METEGFCIRPSHVVHLGIILTTSIMEERTDEASKLPCLTVHLGKYLPEPDLPFCKQPRCLVGIADGWSKNEK